MDIIKCDFCAEHQGKVTWMYKSTVSDGVAICSGCVAAMVQDLNNRAIAFEGVQKVQSEISIKIPKGMKVIPLYDKCPDCGYDLNQPIKTPNNKPNADNIKNNACRGWFPRVVDMFKRWCC